MVGGTVIFELYISSRHWLPWPFPGAPKKFWPLALLSRRPLLTWRECELLALTRTVTEGGVWHHPCVCFIVPQFRSSVVCSEGKFRRLMKFEKNYKQQYILRCGPKVRFPILIFNIEKTSSLSRLLVLNIIPY